MTPVISRFHQLLGMEPGRQVVDVMAMLRQLACDTQPWQL